MRVQHGLIALKKKENETVETVSKKNLTFVDHFRRGSAVFLVIFLITEHSSAYGTATVLPVPCLVFILLRNEGISSNLTVWICGSCISPCCSIEM